MADTPPGLPTWVKVTAIITALLVAVVVAVMLAGGGAHGPGQHVMSGRLAGNIGYGHG